MVNVERGETEQGKDNRLGGVGHHLEKVFDGRVGLLRDVCLHVLLHGDPAKHDRHDTFLVNQRKQMTCVIVKFFHLPVEGFTVF